MAGQHQFAARNLFGPPVPVRNKRGRVGLQSAEADKWTPLQEEVGSHSPGHGAGERVVQKRDSGPLLGM